MNANELKTKRDASKLSQFALEKQTCISRTYISLYVNNRMTMTEEHAATLEHALDKHVASTEVGHQEELASTQTSLTLELSPELASDEITLLDSEYQLLRISIDEGLNEAPEGIL